MQQAHGGSEEGLEAALWCSQPLRMLLTHSRRAGGLGIRGDVGKTHGRGREGLEVEGGLVNLWPDTCEASPHKLLSMSSSVTSDGPSVNGSLFSCPMK